MGEWESHPLYTINIYSTCKEVLELEIDLTFEAKWLFSLPTQMQRSEYYIVIDQSLVYFIREQNKPFLFYGPHGLRCQSTHFGCCGLKAPIDLMEILHGCIPIKLYLQR